MEDEHFEDVEAFFNACQQLRGKRVGIVGHTQIDGDAAGSQIALFEILKNMASMPFLIEPETGIPDNLKFLYEGYELHRPSDPSVEEWCVVDCGTPNRPGKFFEALHPFLLIDHHLPPATFALHNFVHPRAAATCEILADYLYQKNFPIPRSAARALYVGLIMDTGNYTYDSVRASTLRLGAYLLDQGLRPQPLATLVYNQEPRRKFSLLERFLKSWKFYADEQLCFGFLQDQDYRNTGCTLEDAQGFVDYPRSVCGVRISGLLQEYEGICKISLRSHEPALRLDQIAQRFQGGGHTCAAGFLTTAAPSSFWDELMNALQERLKAVEGPSL
ncbi:MAG: DHH family phosphoesterase [Puniceicoccales bacterium]|jgi:phosphoesterase RecJ-like protein|nr:DHH family phosphoesterase [Puniceicoccales bacterium]